MTREHLSMDQLIAVRDGDRSEALFADAHRHIEACVQCAAELHRLHQRTARLRALPTLVPDSNHYPAVRHRVLAERRQSRLKVGAWIGLAAAASLLITVIGGDLLAPKRLDAEQQLASAMTSSQQLERALTRINPDERVIDGRTAELVIQLEDRISDLDAQLSQAATLQREARLQRMVALWQERVSLMNALVDVHVTKASNVDL